MIRITSTVFFKDSGHDLQNALCPERKIAYKNGVSQPRRIALLLMVVTAALYLPVAWNGFCIYDDSLYVTENHVVQCGVTWYGVKWAFTTMAASNWHPLTWLSHMIDCGVFGLNPAGPHLINALLHAANTALLFLLLFRLTGLREDAQGRQAQNMWPAAFIAALFAWHPMHVESVAWIAERKDVLSTFFALLSLLAYVKSVSVDGVRVTSDAERAFSPLATHLASRDFWLSLFCFTLGLMAKPMLVTLPCVLLLLDFWPLRRISTFNSGLSNVRTVAALFVEKLPYFVLAAASCLITFLAQSQQTAKAVASLGIVPLHYRLKSVPVAYVEYVWKTFWPSKLAIFYPLPETIPAAQAVAAGATIVGISIIAFRLFRARPYLFTGWFWFLGMLVPVIGLVQVGSAQIADRYSYLPSVGIFIAATYAALDLAQRWRISNRLLAGSGVAILLACAATMENQLRHWRSNEALFRHSLQVTANNDVILNNLGVALEQDGRLAEAAGQYRAAAGLEPDRFQGHHNLARVLDLLGQHDAALVEHREALKLGPDVPFLHHSMGLALVSAGQTNEAVREFSEAARLDANYPLPHVELAKIDLQQGRDKEAIAELKNAVRIAPDSADILTFTARVLAANENAAVRDGHAAFVLTAKANLLTGGTRPGVLDVMGMACAEMGKFEEAQMAAQQALALAGAQKMKDLTPFQQRLELYKNHRPWRESFRAP